jgi:nucleoprotein TPR
MNEEAMIQHIQKLVADPSGRKNVATIIQLQKNLEQTTMQLEQERNEKARLQVMLERIGEEISTREPQIVQKEKEFARMVKEHQEMSRRLQVAVERSEQESAQLIAVQRQLASAEKRAETLTSQLATLVWDVEQLHGNNSDPAPAGTSEFTFHRVQELVQMNQQLLKVVEETTGGTAGENDAMLDTALEQLKKLMAERERQEEKIRQQNNMIEVYRTQLVESEERRHQLERQGRSNAKRSDAGEVSTQHHQQVDVLAQQSHFDSATLRLEEVRRELDVKNAELKSAADSVNLLKAQLASKEAAFDAETRRSQALNQSTQLLQAQLTDMKERHMGLTKQFSEMEVVLTSAVRENALSKDQVALKEHELLKLRAQSQFLNETVQRFANSLIIFSFVILIEVIFGSRYTQDLATVRTECDRFSRFHQDLQLMLSERSSELQSVKSNAEQESKRLQTEVESLKQEVHSLREQIKIEESQLSLTRSEARQDAEVYKAKFARLQEENAAKTAAHDASLLELGAANVQIAKLNERITELSTILQQQEEALRVEQDAGAQESAMRKVWYRVKLLLLPLLTHVHVLFVQLQAENRKLQATLKSSELALATLKEVTASRASVNDQIETELQRVSQELETSQNRARQEIDERDEEIQRLNTEVTQALQTNDELRAQLSAVQQRLDSIDSVHARELEEAQSATAAAIAEKEGAVETMKIAQDEARIATDSQTELRRTYEIGVRELSESFNVQARLRQEMDELKQRYQEEHSQLLAANSQLQQLKEEQSTAIASSQAERQEMQRRIDEGTQRVKSLLEQLETVNSHLNQLRLSRLVPSTDASALPASGDETVRSLSDTLQYLRRENEIISTELSIAKKDCERLRVQAELFRQNADAARAQLDEEKANRDRLVQSQQEYNDHLQRLEQFNTLRESNACLRSDVRTFTF